MFRVQVKGFDPNRMIVNVYLEFYPGIFQEIIDLLIPLNLKCFDLGSGPGRNTVFPEYPYPDQGFA